MTRSKLFLWDGCGLQWQNRKRVEKTLFNNNNKKRSAWHLFVHPHVGLSSLINCPHNDPVKCSNSIPFLATSDLHSSPPDSCSIRTTKCSRHLSPGIRTHFVWTPKLERECLIVISMEYSDPFKGISNHSFNSPLTFSSTNYAKKATTQELVVAAIASVYINNHVQHCFQ